MKDKPACKHEKEEVLNYKNLGNDYADVGPESDIDAFEVLDNCKKKLNS